MRRLEEAGLAHYDAATATVWVVELAAIELGVLKPSDHRAAGARRWYAERAPGCPWLKPFHARYAEALHLGPVRDWPRAAQPLVVAPPEAQTTAKPKTATPPATPSAPAPEPETPLLLPELEPPARPADVGAQRIRQENAELLRRRREVERWFLEVFWPAYPRRTAKKDALRAMLKLCPDPPVREEMLAALERQKATLWARPDAPIPHPATWINGERWKDEVTYVQGEYVSRKTHRIATAVRAFVERGD
jgi:hypothetical protein